MAYLVCKSQLSGFEEGELAVTYAGVLKQCFMQLLNANDSIACFSLSRFNSTMSMSL